MQARVPLARRNLLADPRRLSASAVGVGLAVMLILLLDGLWTGVQSQVTRYGDRIGADLWVLPPDGREPFSDDVTMARATVHEVAAVEGVDWAAPVRGQFAVLELHGRKVVVTVIGSEPGQQGGAWSLAAGRHALADDEMVLDSVVADRHGLEVGSYVDLLEGRFRVVGLSDETAAFMGGLAFVTHAAADQLFRTPGRTSAVLVGAHDAAEVKAGLRRLGLNALDRQQVRQQELAAATRVYGMPMRLMVGVAFVAGTLVIALTAYTAIAERRREYGIVKAIGADSRRLVRLAASQTAALAAAGLVAGGALFVVARALVVSARPQFEIVLTARTVAVAVVAAAAMAAIAAVVPARRLARLDPATAYRGA